MTRSRIAVVSAAVAIAAAATGCGFGPGESSEGEATLTVTRDYGAEPVLRVSQSDPPESETVIRFLDRETEITTRYAGGFVESIDGVDGTIEGGRSNDWFFFVNGIESDLGAAEVHVRGGDRIWWDYRDWTDALRTPAVVGSWPEPFAQASVDEAQRRDVTIECFGPRAPCEAAAGRLADQGVEPAITDPGTAAEDALRMLVGPWGEVRGDPVAADLEREPAASGVFARFEPAGGGWRLAVLDARGEEAERLGAGAGVVAALRRGSDPATWVVSGVDGDGVDRAVAALGMALADRYAVVAPPSGAPTGVPAG
jgi:hypothetical protein